MKAWLKWDEWRGWCAEFQLDDYETFSPDEPITLLEEDFNDIDRVVLVSQKGSRYNAWVPMEFISLEPTSKDTW
jgi:hypothetical protein